MFDLIPTKLFAFCLFLTLLAHWFRSEIVDCIRVFICLFYIQVFSVYQDTDGTVLAENTCFYFVNTRSQNKDTRFVFLPEEVFRHSVCRLNLPRNQASWSQISGLPHPSSDNILGTQSLIDGALVFEDALKLGLGDLFVKGFIYFFKSVIHIIDIFVRIKIYLAWNLQEHKHPWCSPCFRPL